MPTPKSPIKDGFTLRKFSDLVKIDQSMASRIISGKRLPSLPVMERIGKVFGIAPATLMAARNEGVESFAELMRKRVVDEANVGIKNQRVKAS